MVLARGAARILELSRGLTQRHGVVGGADLRAAAEGEGNAAEAANTLGVDYEEDGPGDDGEEGADILEDPGGNEAIYGNEAETIRNNLDIESGSWSSRGLAAVGCSLGLLIVDL